MNSEAPVNTGHTYANAAEEYEDKEQWSKAIEAHQNAAEQFRKALEYTQDAETVKSLRLLMANHTRRIKDLERKVAKARSEQQQQQQLQDQREGQKQQNQQTESPTGTVYNQQLMSGGLNSPNTLGNDNINMHGLLNALPGMTSPTSGSTSFRGRIDKNKVNELSHHGTIGESYALLSTDNYDDDDDASDPFNKFLQVVETLVDQLSNPVAFASAPLNEGDVPTPYHQRLLSTDEPENPPRDIGNDNTMDVSTMMESFFFVPDNQDESIPATGSNTTASSSSPFYGQDRETLQAENEQLRRRVEQLSRRLQSLEKTAEESNMLKSSILQFRNDVQRQAKRIMQTHESVSMRSSSVALLGSSGINAGATHNSYPRHPGMNQTTNGSSTAELVTRLKDTEDENKRLKDQIDKQQLLMNKYRERWEKLKESAKKRRAQTPDVPSSNNNNSNNNNNNNNINPNNGTMSDYQRSYSSRPPALLRSLAQQSASPHHPPFASSSLAKSSRIASEDRNL
ncbi:hypothetical protein BCR42DRAFT_437914 [Absidia repens]|uniref:MIT domain-containing protein n=1 Tax=Absidia repens TaxID=90262 RepID=A0A1X2IFH9_9FUNG|nr:hypothetical protein BCR42DRAFT_437914 [Absidia repens]